MKEIVAAIVALIALNIGWAVHAHMVQSEIDAKSREVEAAERAADSARTSFIGCVRETKDAQSGWKACIAETKTCLQSLRECVVAAKALDGCCNYHPPKGWVQK